MNKDKEKKPRSRVHFSSSRVAEAPEIIVKREITEEIEETLLLADADSKNITRNSSLGAL